MRATKAPTASAPGKWRFIIDAVIKLLKAFGVASADASNKPKGRKPKGPKVDDENSW